MQAFPPRGNGDAIRKGVILQQKLHQLKYSNFRKNPTPNGRANLPNVVTPGYAFRGKLRATVLKGVYMFVSPHPWYSIQRGLMMLMLPKNLVNRWKAYVRGECSRCGLCCKINFNCSFLADNSDGTYNCTIYKTPYAMTACTSFPINPKDLEEIQNATAGACTFYFEGSPEDLTFAEVAKLYFKGVWEQIIGKEPEQADNSRMR